MVGIYKQCLNPRNEFVKCFHSFNSGATGACDNALLGAPKSCARKGDKPDLQCLMDTVQKLHEECGEKDPSVPFGTSSGTLCGSLFKMETELQQSLPVQCTPMEAEMRDMNLMDKCQKRCGALFWLQKLACLIPGPACVLAVAAAVYCNIQCVMEEGQAVK